MNVTIKGYAERAPWWLPNLSAENPAPYHQLALLITWARDRDIGVTVVIEGADADAAAVMVQDLVDRPPTSVREMSNLIGGRGRYAPYTPEEEEAWKMFEMGFGNYMAALVRENLKEWGMLEGFERNLAEIREFFKGDESKARRPKSPRKHKPAHRQEKEHDWNEARKQWKQEWKEAAWKQQRTWTG